jgi:threonylcarbamoyladenosine tRNA methylthiotransferase MtaB
MHKDFQASLYKQRKSNAKKIAFYTLGCKLNQYETDSLATQFKDAGYTIVPFESDAHAYVINTCTVTNKADRKSRNIVNRAKRSIDSSNLSLDALTGEKKRYSCSNRMFCKQSY